MLSDIKKLISLLGVDRSYVLIISLYVVSSFLDIFGLGLVASYISFFLDENSKSQYLIINSIINKIDVFEPVVTAGFLILY